MSENKQPNKSDFILDMSKSLGAMIGSLNDMKQDWEQGFRKRLEQYLQGLHLVGRDEFEVTKALVLKLQARVDELEGKKAPKKAETAKKATASK